MPAVFLAATSPPARLNRSGLNFQSGAKTPLAAVLAGFLLMLIVLLVAPLAAYLPNAAMAAILFLVAWDLIDFREIKHIWHSTHKDTSVMAVTFFSALFLELEVAILFGVILSLVLYLMRVSKPAIVSMTPDPAQPKHAFSIDETLTQCPQLRFIRIDGSPFFGNINYIQETMERIQRARPQQKHLAIIAEGINFADIAGCDAIESEARQRRASGGDFYMINVKPRLRVPLEKTGALKTIGVDHIFNSKKAAIAAIYQRLDHDICRTCKARIFQECGDL